MNILVVNYEMDDDSVALAWQIRVVRALAGRCDRVVVLTLRRGAGAVPANVTVETLAGPAGLPWLGKRLARLRQAGRLCRQYAVDAVFIHMAHQLAYELYPVFAARRLPVLLWYAHGTLSWHVRLAHACVDRVVTSTPEGFRIASPKRHIIGQGVDTDLFTLRPRAPAAREILVVSRISRRKRLALLLEVSEHLRADGLRLVIVGAPLTEADRRYQAELQAVIAQRALPVTLAGFVPLAAIPPLYENAVAHLSLSQTNSLDKSLLEALACGCPALTSNPAFQSLLAPFPGLFITDEQPAAIAAQVRAVLARPADFAPPALRALIVGHHDLGSYTECLLEHLHALRAR